MELPARRPRGPSAAAAFCLSLLLLASVPAAVRGAGPGVFKVKRKFSGASGHSIADLRNHDAQRHSRILSEAAAVDLPLGGSGLPTSTGLYFTEFGIGSPPKNFTVQVDTGSDVLWVDCGKCEGCPDKTMIGNDLVPYDPKGSSTAKELDCQETSCGELYREGFSTCTAVDTCVFNVRYGDGSTANGHYVTDLVNYVQVSSDNKTLHTNAGVTFGCATEVTGSSAVGIEGVIGFGQANFSMISQMASSGKVRKIFSHCLDPVKGGGIFAIGDLVEPKVKTTPLVPDMPHYNVNLEKILVGNEPLQLPSFIFKTNEDRGTIIDSGTTLAYLPEIAYNRLLNAIFANQPNLDKQTRQDNYTCFHYSGSVDDGFPVVTFQFEMSVALQVKPHDYFFQDQDVWCIGWQNGGDKYRFLLGDLALSNKLVTYDLENQAIGWTDYDCSSGVKLEDSSKALYSVGPHFMPSAGSKTETGRSMQMLLLAVAMYVTNLLVQVF